jgi:hypothetical protein
MGLLRVGSSRPLRIDKCGLTFQLKRRSSARCGRSESGSQPEDEAAH